MYEDILSMQDQLNEVFYESDDLIEEDYYDEDVATEASVKGATKKAFAFVANIIRRVIDAITRWIKNRSINKLVSFLKNKIAKYSDKDVQSKDENGNLLYYKKDGTTTTTKTKNPKYDRKNDQRAIWDKLKTSMNGSNGKSNTDTWAVFCNIIDEFKSADQLVTLQALLRQIKSTPVDKFGKELSGLKATKGFGGNTVIGSIGSGDGILKLFPILNMLVKKNKQGTINKNAATNGFVPVSKGQCDIIGKSLKTFMACISHFMLKTMRYYQSKEDQWTMTSNQKQIVAAIKNCQKIVYDIIKAANVAIGGVNTDNFEEADNESVEVDMNDMMLDMMITNESLTEALNEMDTTEDFDFEF